jgi:diacylglycerol kinase (ATP)
MASSKARIILNPGAGSVADPGLIPRAVREILGGAEVVAAQGDGDLERLAGEAIAQGCDTVIAAGGDGTLNHVLNGLTAAFSADGESPPRVRLGLLPLGTGNDFARSAGIPVDLEHALAVVREGNTRRVDVIRITTSSCVRHMINVSSGGFGTKVSEVASDGAKDFWGRLGYATSFVGALPERDDYDAAIRLDGREEIAISALGAIVANACFVAGGVPIAPEAQLDDGLLDLIVLPTASLAEIAMLTPVALLGWHLENDRVLFRRARKVEIRSEPPMRFNADGELLPAEPITFEVLPRAIEVIIGPAALGGLGFRAAAGRV